MIADLRPGIYDHHCQPRPPGEGMLDDLFGVQTTVDANPMIREARIAGSLAGQPVRIQWDKTACEPGVTLVDGEALGQCGSAPLVIVRKVGQGQVVLLGVAP